MSDSGNSSQNWKTPNELIKLHRLKQKKKALQSRIIKPDISEDEKKTLLEKPFAVKRKNPFAKSSSETIKKQKIEPEPIPEQEDSLYDLINKTEEKTKAAKPPPAKLVLQPFDPKSFAKLFDQKNADDDIIDAQQYSKNLPIDWSLKTRLRILSVASLPATNLKASQEASGLTSFVRCIDSKNSTTSLDISQAARLYQCALFWQHPHIPWLTLFPRNSKANAGIQFSEMERESLAKDWADSFRSLFQLVRARQCPYFYLCANSFTALFRAAGIGGRVEMHALLTPTSRGLRNALKQGNIEFIQPFKSSSLNRSSEENGTLSKSLEECNQEQTKEQPEDDDDEDDLEEEQWLESLGVDQSEIKKIHSTHTRQTKNKEGAEDFSDNSLILVEGVECQALYNFLLNAKSTISTVGRLAGVPPTLLAPVAFPGATMKRLQSRSSKVRMDGVDYNSIELKGVILPHVLHYISDLLSETCDTFSASLSIHSGSLALSKASQKLIEDSEKENDTSNEVFGKENLSDCGLQSNVIEAMCRVSHNAVSIMERMCYDKEGRYAWS